MWELDGGQGKVCLWKERHGAGGMADTVKLEDGDT